MKNISIYGQVIKAGIETVNETKQAEGMPIQTQQ